MPGPAATARRLTVPRRPIRALRLLLPGLVLPGACTPQVIPAGPATMPPAISPAAFVMADGAELPLRAWLPEEMPPRAMVLALHGFGDTADNAFRRAAELFTTDGIAVYAYDQRGFGAAPHRGVWAGEAALAADATRIARLLRRQHPGLPLYVLGESMGGAVALAAAASDDPPPADGLILVAPAVAGRASMSWLTRGILDFAAHTVPLLEFRNSAPGFAPTDDEEAMRGWGRDPLTYKEVRVDAVFGLVGLMDAATAAAPRLRGPVLVLYGAKDRIIGGAPMRSLLTAMAGDPGLRAAYYPQGYHMLLRDRERATVATDILAWMAAPGAPLPSGADRAAEAWMQAAR